MTAISEEIRTFLSAANPAVTLAGVSSDALILTPFGSRRTRHYTSTRTHVIVAP